MDPELITRLLTSIEMDRLVVVCGAGLSLSLPSKVPNAFDLAQQCATKYGSLALAFLLAVHLSRPWCKLKTLILDDPVQHIDDYRALHLAEVLSGLRQLGWQVVCTVEDQALADLLCRRLRSTESEDGVMIKMGYKAGIGVLVEDVRYLAPLPEHVLLSA
jgi:hypothetical protein